MSAEDIQIIIPTTVESRRGDSLRRAVSSVLCQEGVNPAVLLVANGDRVDGGLLEAVAHRPGVTVIREAKGSSPFAQRLGREKVTAPHFGFLDDDDELLPGALKSRLDLLSEPPRADVVVTNGYREQGGRHDSFQEYLLGDSETPLLALLRRNWLASCGALYRSETVPANIWDPGLKYMEWTAAAFKLLDAGVRIRFSEQPTFVLHDTPGSLSKQHAYELAAPEVFADLMDLGLLSGLEMEAQQKLAALQHGAARSLLFRGDYASAWRYHLSSISHPRGLRRYWKFTLRFGLRWFTGLGRESAGRPDAT